MGREGVNDVTLLDTRDDSDDLIDDGDETLIEEISIDGMCGVY